MNMCSTHVLDTESRTAVAGQVHGGDGARPMEGVDGLTSARLRLLSCEADCLLVEWHWGASSSSSSRVFASARALSEQTPGAMVRSAWASRRTAAALVGGFACDAAPARHRHRLSTA